MIRRAVAADIERIAATYEELLIYEKENGGSSNWVLDLYPTVKVPEKRIPQGFMWVLEEEGEICGSMILNKEQAVEYRGIKWKYPAEDNKVLVIHTLCIPPSKAGRGYGKSMIDFAKEFAKEEGCEVVRIDTYAYNEPAKRLYQRNGFRLAGEAKSLLEGLIEEEQVYLEYKIGSEGN